MALVTLKNTSISFGADAILDDVNWTIEPKQRIGLIGRNGAGKSTLLRLLNGATTADEGQINFANGIVTARLIQEVPVESDLFIKSVIAQGHKEHGATLTKLYQSNTQPEDDTVWQLNQRVQTLCSKFDLDANGYFSELSGGLKRRVYLAKSLVQEPDLLLLDEPTNHLDIDTIIWLENLLLNLNCAVVMVSHDRAFIDRLCNQIVEIDRGQLSFWPGNFSQYLRAKEKALNEEAKHKAKFDKKLAQEEAWIRQGIQARRTRNEGRLRALKKMRQQRTLRRERQGNAQFRLNQSNKSGRLVVELKNISHSFVDTPLINDFSIRILRGDKIGIIGQNGCGKSTLIKILTGEIRPETGTVRLGSRLQIAYLDQLRSAIRDDLSVQDNVSGNNEITVNGQTKHIMSYLQDFLFSPSRSRAPAAKLSGGERNRLMLAKLFTQPFNLLILDEPTNDLDYETLELLEQLLINYEGTLLLVSHDRAFINNIVTSTIAFEGNARVAEYIGGYDDWLRQKPTAPAEVSKTVAVKQKSKSDTKLSYKYQRELALLPQTMEDLEIKITTIQEQMLTPDFYQQEADQVSETVNLLKQYELELEQCFSRWEQLEKMARSDD